VVVNALYVWSQDLATYALTKLLSDNLIMTKSLVRGLTRTLDSPSAVKNFLALWSPKSHHRGSKRKSLHPMLRQLAPVKTLTPYFSDIIVNICLCLFLPIDLFHLTFPIKIVYAFLNTLMRATCPHLIRLDLIILTVLRDRKYRLFRSAL
jgi:hypothetical protein